MSTNLETIITFKKNIFYEAKSHCRHKSILDLFLKQLDLESFKNKSFEEIFIEIKKFKQEKVRKGSIGNLTIYDIASDITRYHGNIIEKVYIIGSGPKRAIKLLDIKKHFDKITHLYYVNCQDVVIKCKLEYTNDGDLLETYICQWQKNN